MQYTKDNLKWFMICIGGAFAVFVILGVVYNYSHRDKLGGDISKEGLLKIEEKKLTIQEANAQDIIDITAMVNNCLTTGKIVITKPIDGEDALAKLAKECEKKMKLSDKLVSVREGSKTNQELLNLIK
jgi:hypothetical protein